MDNKKKYLISLFTGIAIACLVALYRGFDFAGEAYQNFGCLSDGGFVIGALFIAIGALTKASESGFFDIFAYGTKSFFGRFFHPGRDDGDYYGYREKKNAERKPALYCLLYAGLTLLALSIFMLILYSSMEPGA